MELRALRSLGIVVALACLVTSPAVAAPVNIDTFDFGSGVPVVSTGTPVANVLASPAAIGGLRGASAAGLNGIGVSTLFIDGGQAGLGTVSMTSTYTGVWMLFYGYTAPATPSDLNADLIDDTSVPNTGLLIEMIKAEYSYNLQAAVSSNGTTSVVSLALPANLNPHNVFVPFSSFTGIDFSDVDQIAFTWTGQPDGDYVVDRITTNVPEPMTLALMAAGGLLALRRRR